MSTPNPYDVTVSGEQQSRGIEFETAAKLAPGLDFTLAYAYIDAEITADNEFPVSAPLIGVPEHSINAWLKYTVQEGWAEGFGVGLGGRYCTSQSGDMAHSFDLPAYGLVNAALYYERDDFYIQINVNNLLDRRHFEGSYSDLYVLPGEPINVSASISWVF